MTKFMKWLDNFWYHYKWRVIIIGFFLLVFIVCAAQCMMKTDPDVNILYAGPQVISPEGYTEMESVFEKCLDADYNGDDEKAVAITGVVILSEEQLEEKRQEAKDEGDYLYYNASSREQAKKQIRQMIANGVVTICVFDPYVYHEFDDLDLFLPLTDFLDEVPACAYDEYSLRFADIPFVDFHDALDPIAENALLCVVKPTYLAGWNNDDLKEQYDPCYALIKKLLAFSLS